MDTFSFTTSELSLRLDTERTTIVRWCQENKIKHYRKEYCPYHIDFESFVDFLYKNPKYFKAYSEQNEYWNFKEYPYVCNHIKRRHPVYSSTELANMLGVTKAAIRTWVSKRLIKPFYKTVYQEYIYTEKSIQNMLQSIPYLKRYAKRFKGG